MFAPAINLGGIVRKLLFSALLLGCASAQATVTDLGTLQPAHTYFTTRTDLNGFFDDTLTFTLPKSARGFILNWTQAHNFDFHIESPGFLNVDTQEFVGHRNFVDIFPSDLGTPFTFSLSGHGGATFALGDQSNFVPGTYLFEVTAVPEPSVWLMLIMGAGFMAWRIGRPVT